MSTRYLDPTSLAFRFLLGLITATQAIGTTVTLPAIPAISDHFSVGADTAQLTLTGFLFGVSAGQIFWGALADRFGRRWVTLAGLTLFTLAGIGTAVTNSIEWLIAFRSIQGVGGAAGMIVGRAMVRDAFEGAQAVKMMAFITSVISLMPMLAPMVGGFALELISWRATLGLIAAISALTTILALLFVGETLPKPDLEATRLRVIGKNIGRYLRTPECIGFALVMITTYGAIFSAMALLPFIAIRVYHLSSFAAAASVAAVAISVLTGSRIGSVMAGRVAQRRTLEISTSLGLFASFWLLYFAWLEPPGPHSFLTLILPAAILAFAFGITQPNCIGATLQPVPEIAGLASAINGSLQMAVGGLFVWLGGVLFDGTVSTIGICAALGGASAFVLYFGFARRLAETE